MYDNSTETSLVRDKSSLCKEDKRREKIIEKYYKKAKKIRKRIDDRLNEIKTSDEYQNLQYLSSDDKKSNFKIVGAFTKAINKYYDIKRFKVLFQNDEVALGESNKNTLMEFETFYETVMEIISLYDAIEKIGYNGKFSDDVIVKIADIDMTSFVQKSIAYSIFLDLVEIHTLENELEEFLEGKREIKLKSEVLGDWVKQFASEHKGTILLVALSLVYQGTQIGKSDGEINIVDLTPSKNE